MSNDNERFNGQAGLANQSQDLSRYSGIGQSGLGYTQRTEEPPKNAVVFARERAHALRTSIKAAESRLAVDRDELAQVEKMLAALRGDQ